MEERASGADDEVDRLLNGEVAHVSFVELDRQAGHTLARDREHRRR